jgi:hypothetical protein
MPFFPRPPWKPLCKPPNKDDINLIDIKPQHEALQIIHTQRTCMKSATTFLRSIFQYLVNFYTGQPEVISSMMNAKTPKAMLKDHAQLNNIWQLLITLPYSPENSNNKGMEEAFFTRPGYRSSSSSGSNSGKDKNLNPVLGGGLLRLA